MNLDQLRYLIEIRRQGSISQAANTLFMTQSALSMALGALEKELNLTIFERGKHGVVPTAHGEKVIQYAEAILQQVDALKFYAEQSNANLKETIKIITGPLMYGPIMLEVMKEVHHISQDIFLDIHEQEARDVENLKNDFFFSEQADFVMWGAMAPEAGSAKAVIASNGLEGEWIANSHLALYVRRNHPLVGKTNLTECDLRPYVILATSALKKILDKREGGAGALRLYPINSFQDIEQLLLSENFILLAQDLFDKNNPFITSGQLVTLPAVDLEIDHFEMRYMLLYRMNHIFTPGEKIFLHCLRKVCAKFKRRIYNLSATK